jgi:UDP-N-acetylglucosamine 2-epimerase
MASLGLTSGGMLHVMSPLGYFEMIGAIRDASVVVTDSGGVQREAYWLGIPCVTMRTETEWHETVALGANVLVAPARAESDLAKVVSARLGAERTWDRTAYGSGDAAAKIADSLEIFGVEE